MSCIVMASLRSPAYQPSAADLAWEKRAAAQFDIFLSRSLKIEYTTNERQQNGDMQAVEHVIECPSADQIPSYFQKLDATILQNPDLISVLKKRFVATMANPYIMQYLCRPAETVGLDADFNIISSSEFEEPFLKECMQRLWLPKIPYRSDGVEKTPYQAYFNSGTVFATSNEMIGEIADHLNTLKHKPPRATNGAISPSITVIPEVVHQDDLPNILAAITHKPMNDDQPLPNRMIRALAAEDHSKLSPYSLVIMQMNAEVVGADLNVGGHGHTVAFLVNKKDHSIACTLYMNSWKNKNDKYFNNFWVNLHDAYATLDIPRNPLVNLSINTQTAKEDQGCGLHAAASITALVNFVAQKPDEFFYSLKLTDELTEPRKNELNQIKPNIVQTLTDAHALNADSTRESQLLKLHTARWNAGSMYVAKTVQEKAPQLAQHIYRKLSETHKGEPTLPFMP
jgi:hypothetical protein